MPQMELVPVQAEQKEILRNLLEKYMYEFSQYELCDVNALGLYDYPYLDYYWTEKNRWAFFIKVDGKLAGFVMVNDFPEADEPTDYSLSEFFVLYKYRRSGVGRWAAKEAFNRFHGRWQLRRHPHNLPSVHFWDRVIEEYTGGNFRLERGYQKALYPDGTASDIFFFET